jgi:hypothetical protein
MFVVVEKLTLFNLLKSALFIKFKYYATYKKLHCYYIDDTPVVRLFIEYFNKIFYVDFIRLSWSYKEMKDKEGCDFGMRIIEQEIPLILSMIITSEANSINKMTNETAYYEIYLKKILTSGKWPGSQKSIRDFILMLFAIRHEAKKIGYNDKILLFINNIIWIDKIATYAKINYEIELTPININIYFRVQEMIRYILMSSYMFMRIYSFVKYRKKNNVIKNYEFYKNPIILEIALQSFPLLEKTEISLDYVTLVNKEHRLGAVQKKDVKDFNRPFIYMSPHLSNDDIIPVFNPIIKKLYTKATFGLSSWESDLIKYYFIKYLYEVQLWECLFKKLDTRLYVTHYLWSAHTVAAAAAINNTGGISVMLQTSFFEHASANTITACDLMFLFSNYNYLKKISGSQIKYNIASGYIRDFTFSTYKENAKQIRAELIDNGAERIISYFDQGSSNDTRWSMGHDISKCGYEFLLNKVIELEWLGLVIKPKKPAILFDKLSEVSSLLDKAVKTGRCRIFFSSDEFLVKNFTSPPALAAYASDLAIHDTLVAGTAGVEAALTGTPTLFFDNYGFSKSLFYQTNGGKIVFNDWNNLWSAVESYFTNENIPELGDWSNIIDKIDPFNDGGATKRINEILHWILIFYTKGYGRDQALEKASKKYTEMYGEDKYLKCAQNQ